MPRTDKANQQIRDARKVSILVSAAHVFARKGYSDTRIADIAQAAGMSQGLIYRYFEGKDQVFAALVEQFTVGAREGSRMCLNRPGTAWDKLYCLTSQILPFQFEQPEMSLVTLQAQSNEAVPKPVREMALQHSKLFLAMVRQLIVEGQEAGQIVRREPDQLAILYLSTLQGLAMGAAHLDHSLFTYPDVDTFLGLFKA